MKIVITEEQFNNLYNTPDRPILTEVEYVVDIIHEEDENNKGEEDEFDLSNGNWISIKQLGETIAAKLGATVSVGEVKGYNNHIDPKFNTQYFSFDYDLNKGLDEVIENGKKFLAKH